MSTRTEVVIGFLSIVVILLLLWVGVSFFSYQKDTPARIYSEAQSQPVTSSTTQANGQVVVVQQPVQSEPSFWPYFFWGYMMGGWGNSGYSSYRSTTNNTYYSSPSYQAEEAAQPSWGSDDSAPTSWGSDSNSDSSWSSSNDSGSWGSDDSDSSWSSGSDSGSWGSDSGSSWGGGESGGWGED